MPKIVSVHLSKKHAFSKERANSVQLIENVGVVGDAHAGGTDQHLFHIRRYGQVPNLRQVHLIHSELFEELGKQGHVVNPGDLGENIVTEGVDLLGLPTGARLKLGANAVIEVTSLRNPCKQIEKFKAGLLKHLAFQAPEGLVRKGGVMAIVLAGGTVKAGDCIEVQLPNEPHSALTYRVPGRPLLEGT